MHSETQPDNFAPIDRIPQELFNVILRSTIRRPGLRSSFSCLVERPNLEPPPGFHSWLPLRLVSRRWNATITSEKHLWSTIIARGPHAREWLILCFFLSVPRHQFPQPESSRSLNEFLISTTFPALTALVLVSDPSDQWEPGDVSPVTFEQHNTPSLTTISVNSPWQVPRPAAFARLKRVSLDSGLKVLPMHVLGLLRAAPQLEEFRLGCGYYQGFDPDSTACGLWYADVGLPVPVTMAHLRLLEFTEVIHRQSDTVWVLSRLLLPRAQVIRLDCTGPNAPHIFYYLPRTLANSVPGLPSRTGLRVVAADHSFGIEVWNADGTRRFIVRCDVGDRHLPSDSALSYLEVFVDRVRCPDVGLSALELDGTAGSLFTQRAEWAALLRCFPKLTRLSIANTSENRVDGRLAELTRALRERGEPLEELVFVGEPPLDLEMWKKKMKAAGVGSVTRVASTDGGSDDRW
ncbi:uncharacterized protein BXZ73DRAFT_81219 [Epithele typhae]|uniref:uncharacterized protein n=1 Tax=Epithele typhae TaxID=378194 RepID=UPI0020080A9B|nr:uncharacterized protein BXZ73DRAFT_81219 [Epithele typhae]KAH9915950.1 hypothetical protein BXZ73DRAFT_81219 [Epithele typhae]